MIYPNKNVILIITPSGMQISHFSILLRAAPKERYCGKNNNVLKENQKRCNRLAPMLTNVVNGLEKLTLFNRKLKIDLK